MRSRLGRKEKPKRGLEHSTRPSAKCEHPVRRWMLDQSGRPSEAAVEPWPTKSVLETVVSAARYSEPASLAGALKSPLSV